MAAAPISLSAHHLLLPQCPHHGDKKKNNKETKWEKDILQRKKKTEQKTQARRGGSITLYKFDDENEPGRTQMGIYIYIYIFFLVI